MGYSNVHKSVAVQGVAEINQAMLDLGTTVLKQLAEELMTEAMEPVRIGLLSEFSARAGKHDNQKPSKSGRWNRWMFRTYKIGSRPGFSRAQVKRAFSIKGFGFRFWTDKHLNYRARVKAWAPGIWIIDGGRYNFPWGNNYPGWRVILNLYKRVTVDINAYMATELPRRILLEAAKRGLS